MWKLVIEDDEGKRTVVPLTRDDYSIGRKEGNTIRLTERNVSREHAKLRRTQANGAGFLYLVEDCTSYNGVYVNGLRVADPQELVHGDLVQIGDYRMVLQDDQVVEAPASVPAISADTKATIPTGAMNRGVTLMERPNRLVMLAGPTPGAEYPLDRERLTVGRAEDATISVNHNSVSRLHCEIHLLGEARYEIADKGSSNGVRVNSQEVKRGIIEAGDVIELGDVKFKFVGAGQIFLPGVNDSQQLATISDRAIPPKPERRGSVLPYILLGAFVAGALVVVWAWIQHRNQIAPRPPVITGESQLTRDMGIVDAARSLADQGNLEGAHAKLGEVTSDSVEASADFQTVEMRWAQDVLSRADREPDPSNKRALYNRVAQDAMLKDAGLRNHASDAIAALDRVGMPLVATPATAMPPVDSTAAVLHRVDPVPPAPPPPTPPTTRKAPPPPPPPDTTPPPSPPTSTKPAGGRSVLDQAREVMLTNPALAKQLLMPGVTSGKYGPGSEEWRVLKAVCDGLKDQVCLDFLKSHSSKPQ